MLKKSLERKRKDMLPLLLMQLFLFIIWWPAGHLSSILVLPNQETCPNFEGLNLLDAIWLPLSGSLKAAGKLALMKQDRACALCFFPLQLVAAARKVQQAFHETFLY